ncbi:MAG: DMT family transporter [Candidatus Cloacimonadaceae bacterium]|jgi:drug/metabolite transporter (DMT)-like permease|nr:DMT family transporter [Candidatus Cloacimonadota bacterium]MDY0380670.1 DMT family transporter [Candidatus Cloacimonadaceae bacterium]HCM15745.1 EamA family transporter [Candidatus Cloacimonas sp.]MCB5263646.1 DMT family transporter [Candidatus Cloacimonadota bacterium]MCB5276185.1 DMT family transporter [Candidatus Cloacimonadota bacterium]
MKNHTKSYIYAGFAILAWSSVSTAFKLALVHLSPVGLLLLSSIVATAFLALYNAVVQQDCFRSFSRNIYRSIPAGFLNPYLYYVILFTAYSRLRAQEAQSLNYTWALVLPLFSMILCGERFRRKDLVALLISFTGVLLISTKGRILSLDFSDPIGTSLALGSSIIWALYWIVSLKDTRTNTVKLFYNFYVGTLFIMLHVIIGRISLFHADFILGPALLLAVWIGIFEMGLTFILWLKALQLTKNTAAISNLIFLSPFLSMFLISGILKESIHMATIIGLVLIVGSNLLQKSGS